MNFTDIAALRAHRDALLEESDKWLLPDWPANSQDLMIQWVNYRNMLREWPRTETDLSNATVPRLPPH